MGVVVVGVVGHLAHHEETTLLNPSSGHDGAGEPSDVARILYAHAAPRHHHHHYHHLAEVIGIELANERPRG